MTRPADIFAGRHVAITGGSRGIDYATARAFLERGSDMGAVGTVLDAEPTPPDGNPDGNTDTGGGDPTPSSGGAGDAVSAGGCSLNPRGRPDPTLLALLLAALFHLARRRRAAYQ